jgi:putative flippase GtrA
MIAELVKFGITGGLGTITNLLIFFLCADLLGFNATIVSIGCFLVAGTQNYLLNHKWSFRKYTSGAPLSLLKWFQFLSGSLLGLAVNITVMNAIIAQYTLPWKFIAQACGILAGMILNFIISKFFVFGRKIPAKAAEQETHEQYRSY